VCYTGIRWWEQKQVSKYPEIKIFIDKLKSNICKKPESGHLDSYLSITGKTIPYRKLSVYISLFSNEYALGYNFITASYVFNNDIIYIMKMTFS